MSASPEADALTWREIRRLSGCLPGGERFAVTVEITEPYPSEHDWTCALRVPGLDEAHGRTRPRKIHGIDAMQTLRLAIWVAEEELKADMHDLALQWPDGGAYEYIPSSFENPSDAQP